MHRMKGYRLDYVLYSPELSTEPDQYMAEIPALPGCRAWGDTPEDTIDALQSVAGAFIDLYEEQGEELPAAVLAGRTDAGHDRNEAAPLFVKSATVLA